MHLLCALPASQASTAELPVFPPAPHVPLDQCLLILGRLCAKCASLESMRLHHWVVRRLHASRAWLANTRDRQDRQHARLALPVVTQTRRPLYPTINPAQRRAFCAYLGHISLMQARPCMQSAPRTSFRTARALLSATRAQRECAPTTTSRITACSGLPLPLLGDLARNRPGNHQAIQLGSLLARQLVNQLDSRLVSQLGSRLDNRPDNQLVSQLDSRRVSQLDSRLDNRPDNQVDNRVDNQQHNRADNQQHNLPVCRVANRLLSLLVNLASSLLGIRRDSHQAFQRASLVASRLVNQLASLLLFPPLCRAASLQPSLLVSRLPPRPAILELHK
jgi:hypothetical protein